MNSFSANNEAFTGACQGTHWRSAALLCLLLPSLAWSQAADGLNVFSDGEVIYAEQINENFRYVLENGGCSATQDGSNVVITCADGSTGVLASAGTVVVYPESSTGELDLETINAGTIVVKDANGVVLGPVVNSYSTSGLGFFAEIDTGLGETFGVSGTIGFGLRNNATDQKVAIGGNGKIHFTGENCEGIPLIPSGYALNVLCRESPTQCFAPKDNLDGGSGTTYLSVYTPKAITSWGEVVTGLAWGCANDTGVLQNARLGVPFFPADEILNASYPLSYGQL